MRFFLSVFLLVFLHAPLSFADPFDDYAIGSGLAITNGARFFSPTATDFLISPSISLMDVKKTSFVFNYLYEVSKRKIVSNQVFAVTSGYLYKLNSRLHFGFGFYSPIDNGTFFDTFDSSNNYSYRVSRSRVMTSRAGFQYAFAENKLRVGLLGMLNLSNETKTNFILNNSNPTNHVESSIRPRVSFKGSVDWELSQKSLLSFSFRRYLQNDSKVLLNGKIPFGSAVVDIVALGKSTYAFYPSSFELMIQKNYQNISLAFGSRYSLWSKMDSPMLMITYSAPVIANGISSFSAKNSFNAYASVLFKNFSSPISASFVWEQNPFKNVAMFVDSDFFQLSLGTQSLYRNLVIPWGVKVGFQGSNVVYQALFGLNF